MYRLIAIAGPDDLARFCAAAGHPLRADTVTRQAPDTSYLLEDAAGKIDCFNVGSQFTHH